MMRALFYLVLASTAHVPMTQHRADLEAYRHLLNSCETSWTECEGRLERAEAPVVGESLPCTVVRGQLTHCREELAKLELECR